MVCSRSIAERSPTNAPAESFDGHLPARADHPPDALGFDCISSRLTGMQVARPSRNELGDGPVATFHRGNCQGRRASSQTTAPYSFWSVCHATVRSVGVARFAILYTARCWLM